MKTLGQLIKEKRKAKGLTQTELADLLTVSFQTVSKYEKDIVKDIPLEKLILLKELLDISFAELPQEYRNTFEQVTDIGSAPLPALSLATDKITHRNIAGLPTSTECIISTDFTPASWQVLKFYALGLSNGEELATLQQQDKIKTPSLKD